MNIYLYYDIMLYYKYFYFNINNVFIVFFEIYGGYSCCIKIVKILILSDRCDFLVY